MRRPRVAWLLETRAPSGAAVMALRRMRELRHQHAANALAMSMGPRGVPRTGPFGAVTAAAGLGGEVRIARADAVVTTSELTLAAAVPRLAAGRLVHFLHTRPELALSSEAFMRRVAAISRLVVPRSVDPVAFAAQSGLRTDQVSVQDDFVAPRDSLLSSARGQVFLAVGRLDADTAVLDLAEAFRLALPLLPDWQLRVVGGGAGLDRLRAYVSRHGLAGRLLAVGPRYDAAAQYADAGVVVRIERGDVSGLSVYEALAAGVPVLGADAVPAVEHLVRHGVNGWVLGRCDPPAIADALVQLADTERRAGLAAAAREEQAGLLDGSERRALSQLFAEVLDTAPAERIRA